MLIILAVSFLVLIMLGMPIAYAMGLSSFIALIVGGDVPLIVVPQRMFVAIDSFSMMAIPLFLLAGELMNSAGITRRIVRFSSTLVGHLRGGLAQVNILASILFSGVNGSAAADSATTGSMLIPAMVEEGYPPEFAGAVTATSSTLGAIKPPSIMMIIYGSITGQSIGALFLGGIVPGFMIAFSLMTVAYIISVKRGYKAREKAKLGEILSAFRESAVALVMPFIVIGGILSGIFTATEAGVVAVVYGLFAGIYLKELNPKKILRIFISAGKSTATIMFVLASAQILGWILARERLPQMVIAALLNISENPTIIMVLI
ncbi:MAG: TRAP transporter large permease, partial [Defluviitaleaceae bacterium]|nr:TRAP transporter large permease [Defluviitaleaceae bacterium]